MARIRVVTRGHLPAESAVAPAVWEAVEEKLIGLQVPSPFREELRKKATGDWQAMLLYGSWARGDADADSDLDVLVIHADTHYPSIGDGQVSLARYDSRDVVALSGTLFGFHLARDGIVLHDTNRQLASALAAIQPPPPPGAIIARVRSLACVLDVSDTDHHDYIEGLTKVGRYLLRTAMYAQALDEGRPCFSVRELAARSGDLALVAVLSSHELVRPAASLEVFDDIRRRLAAVIGELPSNPHGTLHELIEGSWTDSKELSNFATLVLAGDDDELPYDELPRVTL